MKEPCPCKDCPIHTADCHARCTSYLSWQAEVAKEREVRLRSTYTDWQIISATHEKWEKWKRNHR